MIAIVCCVVVAMTMQHKRCSWRFLVNRNTTVCSVIAFKKHTLTTSVMFKISSLILFPHLTFTDVSQPQSHYVYKIRVFFRVITCIPVTQFVLTLLKSQWFIRFMSVFFRSVALSKADSFTLHMCFIYSTSQKFGHTLSFNVFS